MLPSEPTTVSSRPSGVEAPAVFAIGNVPGSTPDNTVNVQVKTVPSGIELRLKPVTPIRRRLHVSPAGHCASLEQDCTVSRHKRDEARNFPAPLGPAARAQSGETFMENRVVSNRKSLEVAATWAPLDRSDTAMVAVPPGTDAALPASNAGTPTTARTCWAEPLVAKISASRNRNDCRTNCARTEDLRCNRGGAAFVPGPSKQGTGSCRTPRLPDTPPSCVGTCRRITDNIKGIVMQFSNQFASIFSLCNTAL